MLPKVVFYGDSNTQVGWSFEGGWLSLLAEIYVRRADMINRGFSGYNTRMSKKIMPQVFPDKTALDGCKLFCIFLGANDLTAGIQNVPIDEYQDNLIWMIQYLQSMEFDPKNILLITVPPVDENKWGARDISIGMPISRHLKDCKIYSDACENVAKKNGVNCLNLYEAMYAQLDWRSFFNDGLHFSRRGSEFLVRILVPVIDGVIATDKMCCPDWKDFDCEIY